jgi:hypothetical protein
VGKGECCARQLQLSASPTATQSSDRHAVSARHAKYRPLFIRLADWEHPIVGWGVDGSSLRFVVQGRESYVVVVVESSRRFSELLGCDWWGGVASSSSVVLWYTIQPFAGCSLRGRDRKEAFRMFSFLWVHWVFVRDWEIEVFGSWLEVLPEYLPILIGAALLRPGHTAGITYQFIYPNDDFFCF